MNSSFRIGFVLACAFVVALAASAARGDTLKLKDGTTIEGTVSIIGNTYNVRLADGTSRNIAKDKIAEHTKGAAAAAGGGEAAPAAPAVSSGGPALMTVKGKADRVESPILAVQMWEKFLDANPTGGDLDTAKSELARWQKLEKDKAERINGKWVGGAEKKELMKRVRGLVVEGFKSLDTQTLEGIKKLEEAIKLYPNSFEANFGLGYFYLVKGAVGATGRGNVAYQEKAVKSLETATRLRPQSPSAWSNLAIAYNYRSRYIDSVNAAYKAVKILDSKETVQNLVNSIAHAPPAMQRNNETLKPVIEDAFVLASKYGIGRTGGTWTYLPPTVDEQAGPAGAPSEVAKEGKPGVAWTGSGFLISGDGYLLTNHHVATGDPKGPPLKNISFRVRLDDGTDGNAELIAVDDKADIALLKIKTKRSVPFLKVADDNPKQAAKALVLGFPVTGEDEPTLQISEGQVKSLHPGAEHEVWFDLNTTFGNSGGPIVDRNGRVIGILSGGRQVFNVTYVMGVGANQIKTFLGTLGAKAPKVAYEPAGTGDFDGERLTEQSRKATVLITAIRGAEQSTAGVTSVSSSTGSTSTTQPAE